MRQVTIVFATGKSWLDTIVTTVTKSRWSHVALRFDNEGLLVEALAGKGLILQPGRKYDEWKPRLFVTVQISEPAYEEMLSLSRQWAETNIPYGYRTSLAIGVKELFGKRVGTLALSWFTNTRVKDWVCSELLATLWRIEDPSFLQDCEPRLLTPDEIFQALILCCPTAEIDKQ